MEGKVSVGGPREGAGRPKGTGGTYESHRARTTRKSREAIALFVEQNIPRLDNWLMQVANGIPKVDLEGTALRDKEGSVVYVVKPDPKAALDAVAAIAEYHLPKLTRATVDATVQVEHVDMNNLQQLSLEQLKAMAIERMGTPADIVDAEIVAPLSLPSWLDG